MTSSIIGGIVLFITLYSFLLLVTKWVFHDDIYSSDICMVALGVVLVLLWSGLI